MKHYSPLGMLLVTILLLLTPISFSDSPAVNTIPIISMKTGQGPTCTDITLDNLCMLLWHNFDGIWVEGWLTNYVETPAELCDSTKAVMILAPSRLQALSNWDSTRWGRYTTEDIQSDCAFIQPNSSFTSIDSTRAATAMITDIETRCEDLENYASDYDCIWYYDIFNEGPSWQLSRMLDDSLSIDNYFPSIYTQDTSLTTVDTDGIFSWVKFKSDSMYTDDNSPTVAMCFGSLHSIADWAEYGDTLGTIHTQANSVRAYFNTEYLEYDSVEPYDTYDNFPKMMDLNTYPIRLAGYAWQNSNDSIAILGCELDQWLLTHYEGVQDSTFIPAATDSDGPFSVNYHPQAFGRTGGYAIWDITGVPPDTTIAYVSYSYRIPSPEEFRMLCYIGLLRGAKGVFPYSIRSYSGWKNDSLMHHDTGLLDENLIPFDAPYEEWVYRDRPVNKFYYAPPDLIPPWTDAEGNDFDPLYSLPSRPIAVPGSQRNRENYLLWKFEPYGRLWNSVSRTFGQIATVAPELSGLWWWFDYEDEATVNFNGGSAPLLFIDPQIKVFTDSTESNCYLFYVNKFCRGNNVPLEIVASSDDFPDNPPFSEYALDHSRRFLIQGNMSPRDTYNFLDTLDAGEARLLQMFDESEGLDADVRITDPDLFAILPAKGDTLVDNRSPANESVDIVARFYNMGTESQSNIWVFLYDETDSVKLDSTRISLDGLSTSTCWTVEREEVFFEWTPDSTEIGVHVLKAYAETWLGEPDPTDNSAHLVFIVDPRDYAGEVLDDPWDMTEAAGEDWHTDDITAMVGWESTYSDSISGMFEGELTSPSAANKMQLNTGGASLGDSINTSLYQNLTIAAKAEITLDVEVHWLDMDSTAHYVDLGEDITTTWTEIGPINLQDIASSEWDDDSAISFWLEFSGAGVIPKDVRIGWIKLTE